MHYVILRNSTFCMKDKTTIRCQDVTGEGCPSVLVPGDVGDMSGLRCL